MSELIQYWETIIDEYRASGLSQPVFCKQNGLSLNQFHYRWERRAKFLDQFFEKLRYKISVCLC